MKLTKLIPPILNLFVFLLFSFNLFAVPGDLDPTFGTGGKVETSIGIYDDAADAAVQSDGKIIVLGNTSADGSVNDLAFVRYNSDGSLDTSFGSGGTVVFAEAGNQIATAMLLQTDGKIIAVGSDGAKLAVYRLNTNGTLDTSFGTGGKFVLNLSAASQANDVLIQPDGKIVLAGFINNISGEGMVSLVRLNTNGTLDTTFNSVGYVSIPGVYVGGTHGMAAALQSDGKIVVGGHILGVIGGGFLGRFNSNGAIDGELTAIDFKVADIALQTDGKIVCAGYTATGSNLPVFAVMRRKADKTADTTFGTSGLITIDWGNLGRSEAKSLIIEPDGRILIGGLSFPTAQAPQASIVRLNATGFLDVGFGNDGKVISNFKEIRRLISHPDGKSIGMGSITFSSPLGSDLVVARYLGGGSNTGFNRTPFDFDGDGKADIAVYRPSTASWYVLQSFDNSFIGLNWGTSTDKLVPADFTGDGRTDFVVNRDSNWYGLSSSNYSFFTKLFGTPVGTFVPADYDGDGKSDYAEYRFGAWSYIRSSNQVPVNVNFGNGESVPLPGDYDGDGKADVAVFNVSLRFWYIRPSANINTFSTVFFGFADDRRTPADFDGDGKTDIAVFRPSNGTWYWINSSNGTISAVQWGANGDKPVAADYDGDGKADVAVFRPSDGTWYIYQSTLGFKAVNWGLSTDIPIPNVYIR